MALHLDRSLNVPAGLPVCLSPMVERLLAPNPGPFTFRGTGVYIVGAGDTVAVIDPGPALPQHLDSLKRALGTRKVSHILVTHTHNDHSPAAAPLKAWSGAKIFSGPAPAVPRQEENIVDEAHDRTFAPDIIVRDGDIIAGPDVTFECIATPGHTAGHICYALAQEQALFSGDHVMGWSTSVIAPPDGDMAQYIASLEKLGRRDDLVFYPTHGSPIESPQDHVRALVLHRRQRAAQIVAAIARGTADITSLVASLYPDLEPALIPAAAAQVQAHLDQMAREGAVIRNGLSYRLSS